MAKINKQKLEEYSVSLKKAVKNNPFSVGTFVLSGGNLATNLVRHKSDKEYQEEQLEAMKDLTSSLTGVNRTLKKTGLAAKKKEEVPEEGFFVRFRKRKEFSEKTSISFRRKEFSILGNTLKGANIGAGIGTLGSIFAPKTIKIKRKDDSKTIKEIKKGYNSLGMGKKRIAMSAGGAIIGAALGALYGVAEEISTRMSRTSVNGHRMMPDIVGNLKKLSFEEDVDFTRDPKVANQLKTRVCIVVTKTNGDLRVLINTVSDYKLKNVAEETLKNLPNTSAITNNSSNNFNEINITTISDGSADVGLVTGICERFIRSGYPIYLIEVG